MRPIDLTATSVASAGTTTGGSIEVCATLEVAPSAGEVPGGSIFGGAS